jgi:hypothetical protein
VVESPPGAMGCPVCGVVAHSRGRRVHTLTDVPVVRATGHGAMAEADLAVCRGGVVRAAFHLLRKQAGRRRIRPGGGWAAAVAELAIIAFTPAHCRRIQQQNGPGFCKCAPGTKPGEGALLAVNLQPFPRYDSGSDRIFG